MGILGITEKVLIVIIVIELHFPKKLTVVVFKQVKLIRIWFNAFVTMK